MWSSLRGRPRLVLGLRGSDLFSCLSCVWFVARDLFVMKILSWNSQGAASSGFRHTLFLLVKKIKPDLVGLLEPRISGNAVDKACKSFGFENWIRVEVVGFSGGIWLLWRNNINFEIIATNPQFVFTHIRRGQERVGLVSFVYGSPTHYLRNKLWEKLSMDKFNL